MLRLFEAKKIRVEIYGRKDRETSKLVIIE